MPVVKLTPTKCTHAEFVNYWSPGYQYVLEDLYEQNIGKDKTEERVLSLYRWKNGKNLSQSKLLSIEENYFPYIEAARLNTKEEGIQRFNALNGGSIWDIFSLHIDNPEVFPIFDQHTFRAFHYLTQGEIQELPKGREQIRDIYFNKFIPFLAQFEGIDNRKVDKALFTFGRFLKKHRFLFV